MPDTTTTVPDHVAIIGAGLSGLACATALVADGIRVTVFDKGRGPGGRMSTKRRPDAQLDLGAQTFTVSDERFEQEVDQWQAAGCARVWPKKLYKASPTGWQSHHDGHVRYSGAPSMNAIPRHLANALNDTGLATLHTATSVTALRRDTDSWYLDATGNPGRDDAFTHAFGPFSHVVVSVPSPQAAALVTPWDDALAARCHAIQQRACWSAFAVFERPLPLIPGVDDHWQMAQVDHPALRLVSRNQTKPGREDAYEGVSLVASLQWSEEHLEMSAEQVVSHLMDALKGLFPAPVRLPETRDSGAHRWRYSEPAVQDSDARLADYLQGDTGLSLCGDNLRQGRVEDAWLSGHRLGCRLAGRTER